MSFARVKKNTKRSMDIRKRKRKVIKMPNFSGNKDDSRDIGIDKEGRRRGMTKFLRDVFEGIKNEDEGREGEIRMGTVSWKRSKIFIRIEYGFEEKTADPNATFKFRPAANNRQGGTTRQGTDIEDMGGNAEKVGRFINTMAGLPLEFAELDAASIGHSNLTNYEFKYETSVETSKIENLTFEEVLQNSKI
jgi:hypothetical protein